MFYILFDNNYFPSNTEPNEIIRNLISTFSLIFKLIFIFIFILYFYFLFIYIFLKILSFYLLNTNSTFATLRQERSM